MDTSIRQSDVALTQAPERTRVRLDDTPPVPVQIRDVGGARMRYQNEHLVRRVYEEILNQGDLAVADDLIDSDAVDHTPTDCSSLPSAGPESLKAFVALVCTAFPDVSWRIDNVHAQDDRVVVHSSMHGSHHASFRGVPPSGNAIVLEGIDTVRIADGKIVEHWGVLASLDKPWGREPNRDERTQSLNEAAERGRMA